MSYTRLAAGAHYLTDVAAAAIIGYTAFLTAGAIYIKALGEDIKEHGASSAPCFYVRIIFEQEKLSVFRLCPTEASYLRHSRLCETGNLLLFLYRPKFTWLTALPANRRFQICRF